MLTVTKIFRFEAAHQLPYHKGACQRLHGHSYVLEVEVSGVVGTSDIPSECRSELSVIRGMIIDFGILKEIVVRHIISKLDHTNLNNLMNCPTAENLVLWVVETIGPYFPRCFCTLERVRLSVVQVSSFYETVDSYAEWKA